MRSDSPTPSPEGVAGNTTTTHARVVPIDSMPNATLRRLFAPEAAIAGQGPKLILLEGRENSPFRSEYPPDPPKDDAPSQTTVVRFSWRNMLLGLLGLVVLAQGGLMGYWMSAGGVSSAPPDFGSVTVTSEPSGSLVMIDGSARGATPLTVSLAAGSHSVSVGTGTQLRTQSLNVNRGGDASMHVELATAPAIATGAGTGGLHVATEPGGARVWIDGEARGVAPLTIPDLKIGEHVVTVRGGSGEAVNRTVNVQAAAVASLIISMKGPAAFASGWIAVTSAVPVQIWERGELVGTTDMPRVMLPAGAHQLELVNKALDYRVSRDVQITAGRTAEVALQPPMGTLSVNALPWAEVWIDGRRTGETPIGNVSIAIGNHEVLFRHPELGEQRQSVSVGAVTPARVGVDMRKP